MPLPSPHVNEEAVQLDPALVIQWRELEQKAAEFKKEADRVKALLMQQLGDATAGKVGDDKVITYRFSDAWATSRLVKDNPELTQHFFRVVQKDVFDLEAFKLRHPDIANQYRIRAFKAVE